MSQYPHSDMQDLAYVIRRLEEKLSGTKLGAKSFNRRVRLGKRLDWCRARLLALKLES